MTLELISCTYGYGHGRRKKTVLSDFDYQLPPGLTVLLGPNGAGKSTLLKVAASVVRPDRGSVVCGRIPSTSKEFRRTVARMPQDIVPLPGLTAREYVAYVGWLKGMNRSDAWKSARRVLARVELTEHSEARTTTLSGGQLRRVGVAAALVHGARVLLLDEPTAGMDPRQRRVFRDLLRDLTGDVSILMSTHDVADLAEDADHVSVLAKGRILHSGTTDTFLRFAPVGTAAGRQAEGAYTELLGQYE
ncbi:ABC-type multidrug transport system, ATPase component [Streptomyces sp. DI166]|uniref:ATP-binding cassette domain-containing protein n=1 Tax=Streptomyces sp. DI166 TaxID=1839783 RepID=UPI0007F4BF25|nr:ATP-binding cassette domain-containing protein [Streptomyces sp. DI166]SBT90414.1 ABC-type multidrug transport system, ATPase component [Streptomyces sp. DI166]